MAHELVKQGRFITIVLSGSVDLSDSGAIKAAAEAEITPDMSELRVDGSGLDYIDSSGVAALLYLKKLATRCNAKFAITAMSLGGRRVIELAKLQTVLGLSADVPLAPRVGGATASDLAGITFRESDAVQAITSGGTSEARYEAPPVPPGSNSAPQQNPAAAPPEAPAVSPEPAPLDLGVKPGSFS